VTTLYTISIFGEVRQKLQGSSFIFTHTSAAC